MRQIIYNFLNSLDTAPHGFSYRKVLSLITIGCVVFIHAKFVDSANAMTALIYDFGFICVLLGLLNLDRFLELKFGKGKDDTVVGASQQNDQQGGMGQMGQM